MTLQRPLAIESINGTRNTDTVLPNPTFLPDDIFDSFTPIIIIRHPGLILGSLWRTQKPILKVKAEGSKGLTMMTSLQFAKMWFDAKKSAAKDSEPIVVDAEDFVYNTEPTMTELCLRLGIDPSGMQYQWDIIPAEQWPGDALMHTFFQDLMKSTGIKRAETVT